MADESNGIGSSIVMEVNLLAKKKDGASQKSNEIPNISYENVKSSTQLAQTMAASAGKANNKVS